jgi:hypothetical protein
MKGEMSLKSEDHWFVVLETPMVCALSVFEPVLSVVRCVNVRSIVKAGERCAVFF